MTSRLRVARPQQPTCQYLIYDAVEPIDNVCEQMSRLVRNWAEKNGRDQFKVEVTFSVNLADDRSTASITVHADVLPNPIVVKPGCCMYATYSPQGEPLEIGVKTQEDLIQDWNIGVFFGGEVHT